MDSSLSLPLAGACGCSFWRQPAGTRWGPKGTRAGKQPPCGSESQRERKKGSKRETVIKRGTRAKKGSKREQGTYGNGVVIQPHLVSLNH